MCACTHAHHACVFILLLLLYITFTKTRSHCTLLSCNLLFIFSSKKYHGRPFMLISTHLCLPPSLPFFLLSLLLLLSLLPLPLLPVFLVGNLLPLPLLFLLHFLLVLAWGLFKEKASQLEFIIIVHLCTRHHLVNFQWSGRNCQWHCCSIEAMAYVKSLLLGTQ